MTESDVETVDRPETARRLERLRRARLIKSRRPLRILLLVGGIVLLVAVVSVIFVLSQRDVTQSLVEEGEMPDADLRADIALTSIDPQSGELGVRLIPGELGDDRTDGGLVTRGFRILVNDVGGQTSYTFPEGQPIRAIDFSVALTDGSVYGYPFDNYEAGILVLAADGTEPTEGEPLSIESTATSSLLDFDLSAETDDCFDSMCLTIDVRRPASTIGYTVWFIALVWGLSLAGLGVLYITIRRGVEIPLWAFGYLVGVLFALPPLRNSLPASPPAGGFVDFVAFYWSTAIIGVTLLLLVGIWIRESRQPPQQ